MFFKKNKVKFDAQQPNQIKNALNIICPNCSNEQSEPKRALSTNCKKCSTYFKIVKGKAVPPSDNSFYSKKETKNKVKEAQPEAPVKKETPLEEKKAVVKKEAVPQKESVSKTPATVPVPVHVPIPVKVDAIKSLPTPISTEVKVPVKKAAIQPSPIKTEAKAPIKKDTILPAAIEEKSDLPKESSTTPTLEETPKSIPEQNTPEPAQAPKRYVPTPSPETEKESATGLFGKGKSKSSIKSRDVSCLECDRVHQAPLGASSTNCPQCGTYITLKDFDIKGPSNQRIQTRGNVVIHKKASVTGITIQCHDLTVTGQFTGGVNCSGDFILNSHGKLMGEVKCKRLIIEKRADIEFVSHVYAEEIIIDGTATGNFTCSGKLVLKKKATITGDITVKTMTMEEGAKHTGRMSIGQ